MSIRIAAVGDVHVRAEPGGEARVRELVAGVAREADVLVLAGDLTDHGRAQEAEMLLRGLDGIGVPVVAVLGNHDHDSGEALGIERLLRSAGVHVLDRDASFVWVSGVGFAGVKGFAGGFEPLLVRSFGEASLKQFVTDSVVESEALRVGLRALDAPRVAVTHYSPVRETIEGEPVEIHPFLGTSRLARAIDEGGDVALALHGHAHHGSPAGTTPGGVPVRNVSLPVLRERLREKRGYLVFEVGA